jgi:queuosine biosynthesis protein QueC
MCGIVSIWNRDGAFSWDHCDLLFEEAEKRGQDGFGITLIPDVRRFGVIKEYRSIHPYGDEREEVRKWFEAEQPKRGSLILANFRAQPETEVSSSEKNLQPIVYVDDGLFLVHNGSVANFVVSKYTDYQTEIDSEVILKSYQAKGDMSAVMKEMVGGFAFLLYDQRSNRLFCVNDFKPLAICCIRGRGVILHSSLSAVEKVVQMVSNAPRCGMNVWEDWYYHWQDGNTIREIDLDSGMERITTFVPNRYHPVWRPETASSKAVVLVSSSGGIDSGLSAFIMNRLGYDVVLVNFNYGQLGREAEARASVRLAEHMGCEWRGIDLELIFKNDPSSLIRSGIPLETGTDGFIKTTTAWVSNRNAIFLAVLASLAEQKILSNEFGRAYIVTGMSSLSEEGFYPDNSEYFIKSFMEMTRYSTLVGGRIEYVPVLQRIMKSEEWILGEKLGFPFELTVSCDNPRILDDGTIELCRQCGSTLLSQWAAEMAGVPDPRKFYDRPTSVEVMRKRIVPGSKKRSVWELVPRLLLPKDEDYQNLVHLLRWGK